MNNRVIAAILIVIVVAGGAFWLSRNNKTDVAGESEVATGVQSEANVETGSIKSLIEAGNTRQCTYQTKESGNNSFGVMYAHNGKMRADITVEHPVETMKSETHMIYDGTSSYMWMEGQTTGFKTTLDASAQTEAQNQSVDLNKNYDFKCEDWSADNSKFELPSNVQFNDMGTITGDNLNATGEAITNNAGSLDTKEAQQAVCNSLPEPSKTACLNAM